MNSVCASPAWMISRAIVFDMMFVERDRFRPEDDAAFAESAARHANTYFAFLRLPESSDSKGIRIGDFADEFGLVATRHADPEAKIALVPPLVLTNETHRRAGLITFKEDADGETRHDLRIRIKRLRYAIEAAGPTYGTENKGLQRFGDGLARLQDVLGESQDSAVAQASLTSIATRGSKDPLFCIAIGRLIERESRELQRSGAMFSKAWGKLDRKKNLTWLQG